MLSLHFAHLSQLIGVVIIPAIFYTISILPTTIASAYVMNPNALTDATAAQKQAPTSSLASKVIFHSPSMANMYKEFIVSSKPLNLRKHNNGSKTKKTKKDSKIYYIPIPPLPYRYIPGVGLDYQPMKIKPILQEAPPSMSANIAGISDIAHITTNFGQQSAHKHQQQHQHQYQHQHFNQHQHQDQPQHQYQHQHPLQHPHQHQQQPQYQQQYQLPQQLLQKYHQQHSPPVSDAYGSTSTTNSNSQTGNSQSDSNKSQPEVINTIADASANKLQTQKQMQNQNPNQIDASSGGESKIYRMHRGDYYFNGRPFRLQVAHAQPKNQLTPQNLKSKLYFNKKFIY